MLMVVLVQQKLIGFGADGDNLSAAEKSSNATSVGTDITKSSVPSTNPAASVRILCFVTTSPKTAPTRLQAVKDTWSKRCDKMLFFSSVNDSKQSIIGLTVTEGYQQLWGKTKAAFMYIYQYHLDDADWFLKADDDTYVVLDNLRLMLEQYKSPTPVYFGHHLRRPKTNQSFMSGGAGYVLNKVGLTKLVKQGICNNTCQPGEKGAEDVLLGQCLERIGVVRGDSRDELGKQRFVLSSLDNYFKTKLPKWIKAHEHFQYTTGKECCSDSLITVHGVTSDEMYLLDYLIYKVGSLLATHH
ncbi:glycoprotein-N-acetylgalactosamine 3-beta-galactosyltransferase 1-like [Glandiceps talaboti]